MSQQFYIGNDYFLILWKTVNEVIKSLFINWHFWWIAALFIFWFGHNSFWYMYRVCLITNWSSLVVHDSWDDKLQKHQKQLKEWWWITQRKRGRNVKYVESLLHNYQGIWKFIVKRHHLNVIYVERDSSYLPTSKATFDITQIQSHSSVNSVEKDSKVLAT